MPMISEVILGIASVIALLAAFAQRPTHAYCGNGWYANRISASGFYSCERTFPYELDESSRPYGWRVGWIACRAPQRAAIGIDGVSIVCRSAN